MRYLGVDYGSKRIGIALSDEEGKFAMPHKVLQNKQRLADELHQIICDNNIGAIVIGESKDYHGKDNKIMAEARVFKSDLENKYQIPVLFEPEFLTSHQAEKIQGKTDLLDASAAAIILQSYLDRSRTTETMHDDTMMN